MCSSIVPPTSISSSTFTLLWRSGTILMDVGGTMDEHIRREHLFHPVDVFVHRAADVHQQQHLHLVVALRHHLDGRRRHDGRTHPPRTSLPPGGCVRPSCRRRPSAAAPSPCCGAPAPS